MITPEPNMFEDVWLSAYYPVHLGAPQAVSDMDDSFIRAVMTRNDGVLIGSGCMLVGENPERDIQCRIKRGRAMAVVRALEANGYRTQIMNIPQEV